MTKEEYIRDVPSDRFYELCKQAWHDAGAPILPEMMPIILEEYNNDAVERIEAEWEARHPEPEEDE